MLVNLAGRAPLLVGADQVAFVDIDDTIGATHGYKKQGAGYGYCGVKGLNAVVATISIPTATPVIAPTRLRRANVNSAKGAPRLVADALVTAKSAGATGMVTVRADSAYYNHAVIAAAHRGGARFWHHRPHGPSCDQGDHHDQRGRLGRHQVPERDLGRRRPAVGL